MKVLLIKKKKKDFKSMYMHMYGNTG